MKKLKEIEKTALYFNFIYADAVSYIAWRQKLRAYNDILILMFHAQNIQEEKIVKTPHGFFFYHKDGLVYERQFYPDKNMPYGDLAITKESLTSDAALYSLYGYLSGGAMPPLLEFHLDEKRYSVVLINQ